MAWRATKGDERYLWGGLFSPMPHTFPATEHLQELWGGPPGLRRASTPACSVARRAGPGGPAHSRKPSATCWGTGGSGDPPQAWTPAPHGFHRYSWAAGPP